jgi:GR25 family glycosyltransferase involved in LPS biosynthesis
MLDNVHTRIVNLSHRTDRRSECVLELNKIGLKYSEEIFFPARYHPEDGALGCALSHATVLADYLASSLKPFALILEDDFEFNDKDSVRSKLEYLTKASVEWDVYLLAHNQAVPVASTSHSGVFRVFNAQTTAAYIVRRQYATDLIGSFFRSAEHLRSFLALPPESRKITRHFVAADMLWKSLQTSSNFYASFPAEITQRASFSDIENTQVDYEKLSIKRD